MYFRAALLLAATTLLPGPGPANPGISKIAYETASGGRLGGFSSLVITPDSTVYVEGTRSGRQTVRAKTTKATWNSLTKAFTLSSFRQVKSHPGHQAVDGTDVTLTITQGQQTVSCVNGEEDTAHYKAIAPFAQLLDAQLTQFAAKISH